MYIKLVICAVSAVVYVQWVICTSVIAKKQCGVVQFCVYAQFTVRLVPHQGCADSSLWSKTGLFLFFSVRGLHIVKCLGIQYL